MVPNNFMSLGRNGLGRPWKNLSWVSGMLTERARTAACDQWPLPTTRHLEIGIPCWTLELASWASLDCNMEFNATYHDWGWFPPKYGTELVNFRKNFHVLKLVFVSSCFLFTSKTQLSCLAASKEVSGLRFATCLKWSLLCAEQMSSPVQSLS